MVVKPAEQTVARKARIPVMYQFLDIDRGSNSRAIGGLHLHALW